MKNLIIGIVLLVAAGSGYFILNETDTLNDKVLNNTEENKEIAELKETILQEKNENKSAIRLKARHILFNEEDKDLAVKVLKEAQEGADFANLARQHSKGPTAVKGGDLGWFEKDVMVKPFADAISKMETGSVSKELVKTQFGLHIIKLEDKEDTSKGFIDGLHYRTVNVGTWICPDANILTTDECREKGHDPIQLPTLKPITQFFYYGCPHCYKLELDMKNWKKDGFNLEIVQLPAVFNEKWGFFAMLHLIAENEGVLDKVKDKFFEAFHVEKVAGTKDFINILKEAGVDVDKIDDIIKDNNLQQKGTELAALGAAYKLDGVPSFIIHSKYYTDVTMAGGSDNLKKVIEYLNDLH